VKKNLRGRAAWLAAVMAMACTAILTVSAAQATNAVDKAVTSVTTVTTTTTSTTVTAAETTQTTTTTQSQTITTTKPQTTTTTQFQTTTTASQSTDPVTIQGAGKTLEAMYGDLSASTGGHEAIQARISGNTLTIDAYVNFKGAYSTKLEGKTYAALAKQGLRLWAGTYQGSRYDFEPGTSFTVQVHIYDIYDGAGARPGQNYFDFVCLAEYGRAFTFYGVGYYNRELLGLYKGAIPDKSYTNGAIGMYRGISGSYTAAQYVKVAAHEFGHVLGLGDLYRRGVASTQECPQGRKYAEGDIMGTHGHVTPNNIEMMLEAYTTGRYQAYVNSGLPEVKSKVIQSY